MFGSGKEKGRSKASRAQPASKQATEEKEESNFIYSKAFSPYISSLIPTHTSASLPNFATLLMASLLKQRFFASMEQNREIIKYLLESIQRKEYTK
jgi:hypothetical protein